MNKVFWARIACWTVVLLLNTAICRAGERVHARDLSLVPAEGWTVQKENVPATTSLVLVAPDSTDFRTNLNVVTQPALDKPLEAFFEDCRQEVRQMGTVAKDKVIEIGGQKALRLVWTADVKNSRITLHATVFRFNGRSYVITCSARPGDYPRYAATFDEMAASVQFDKSKP